MRSCLHFHPTRVWGTLQLEGIDREVRIRMLQAESFPASSLSMADSPCSGSWPLPLLLDQMTISQHGHIVSGRTLLLLTAY